MIQLKRVTSGDISGLEYGQLGVTYDSGVAKLYVGDSSNRPMEVTTNLPEPYNLDCIKPGTNSDGLFWSDNSDTGLAGTYRWTLSSSSRFDINSPLTRIFSGGEIVGFFESYSYIQNQDGTAKVSTQNGVKLDSPYDGIQITSTNGSINVDAAEVDITASPSNTESSFIHLSSTITLNASSSISIKTDSIMVEDESGSNELYISSPGTIIIDAAGLERVSGPVTDNDLVTKKYVNNLSYSPQASITINLMAVIGFVRQLNEVLFSIPLDWQLSETSFYDCQFKSGNMEVMQGDASTDSTPTYIFGGGQGGQPVVGNVKVGNVYRGHNVLTIRMVKEDGSNFTKAHTGPCCIMLRNVTIAGTSQS